jgi:hypothetical protein
MNSAYQPWSSKNYKQCDDSHSPLWPHSLSKGQKETVEGELDKVCILIVFRILGHFFREEQIYVPVGCRVVCILYISIQSSKFLNYIDKFENIGPCSCFDLLSLEKFVFTKFQLTFDFSCLYAYTESGYLNCVPICREVTCIFKLKLASFDSSWRLISG